ncbi:MAG: hypothetical protein Q4B28_05410 [bacterium]|nr:hypothetical protein [bacterium]
MNTVLLYLIDATRNGQGKVYHIGGQAMYGYIKRSQFLSRVKEMLELIDDDHDITNGLQLDGIEILPAHFFRFLGYDEQLLDTLSQVFGTMDEIDYLNKEKGQLFKQNITHTDPSVQELMQGVKLKRAKQEELIRILASHQEINKMPYATLREGTLCEPYHSQLDLYAQLQEGFDPKEKRGFFLEQDLGRIQTVVEKVVAQACKK